MRTAGRPSSVLRNNFKSPAKGQQETPVVGAKGLVIIMNLLQGERAAKFRAVEVDVLVRCLGADLSLNKEVIDTRRTKETLPEDNAARVF